MAHWGWYWKIKQKEHSPKLLCSDLPFIDSFLLFKKREHYAFMVPRYQLKAIPEKNSFCIYYGNKKQPSYVIKVEEQKCNYGGHRYYFQCPLCQHRMRKLYFSNGAFLCRKCLNLGYYSQRLRPSKRYEYMQNNVEESVKIEDGNWHINKKPLNMKMKTYKKLKHLWLQYDMKAREAFKHELIAWQGKAISKHSLHYNFLST